MSDIKKTLADILNICFVILTGITNIVFMFSSLIWISDMFHEYALWVRLLLTFPVWLFVVCVGCGAITVAVLAIWMLTNQIINLDDTDHSYNKNVIDIKEDEK